ncbi:Uroporphyrinogen-III C-methyltransferase [Tetrabaena socialis]|uniref:uroporphyrinogen-III C-methyltransferase n=1 Tax=Tetrabaena socialis TaxID=47790 RepID=A0A2J8AAN9_9CHLO|nr:Uroporphyrinogen-III C-methyltransferase [Tetrabaena socialis]|eukprot:PNH09589.1 Uroporphyrinogen-III C-methyltransferase [Tetrabaena socialis]
MARVAEAEAQAARTCWGCTWRWPPGRQWWRSSTQHSRQINEANDAHRATTRSERLRAASQPKASTVGRDGQAHASVKCWLVGAGPGPADYLTLKAVRLLEAAEVIVYDDLGSQGLRVVRLKGGCPSVFSRLASEIAALSAAGVPFELVPGISSALSAPLFAGFPLTHVDLGPSFTVLSGHDVEGTDWGAQRGAGAAPPTLVLLMAGAALGRIAARMVAGGWEADMPVAVIRSAGLPEQRVWRSSLERVGADTADAGPLSPCVVVVGRVAALGGGGGG